MSAYSIDLRERPSTPLAVIRRRVRPTDLSRVVPECCGAVWRVLRSQNLRGGRNVAVYWDDAIRLEAGVELEGAFVEEGDVKRSVTPSGLVASATHLGPYAGLGVTHQAIVDWCRAHRHRILGPRWELYDHWRPEWDADPSQIRTDVFYVVSPT